MRESGERLRERGREERLRERKRRVRLCSSTERRGVHISTII